MKYHKLLPLITVISLFVLLLTSCTGGVGPAGATGPAGEKGATGAAGATGTAGAAGTMSAAQLGQLQSLADALGIPITNATAMKTLVDQRTVFDAAKKEGKLVIYTQTQTSDTAIFFLREAFERKYPEITVEFVMSSVSVVVNRFIDESSKGVKGADVIIQSQSSFVDILKNPDSLAKYVPVDSGWLPAALKEADGRWTSSSTAFYGIGYNTKLIAKADAPKNYADLLAPKWKGKIAMVDPKTSAVQAAVWKTMEKQYGEAFIRQLAGQNITFLVAADALSKLVSGEFPIYLNTLLSTFESSKIGGAAVDWIRQSDNITLTQPVCSGIAANAPHPNAAKLFSDFLISKEGQQIYADRGAIPNMAGLRLANPDLSTQGKKMVPLETVTDAERTAFLAAFQAKYSIGFPP